VWDASGSGANRDHGRELAVLDGYFRALGSVTVQLVQVRDVALPAERFEVSGGDWRALRSVLEKMVYDGATNLGAIAIPASCRLALLFSDGLGNYGPDPMRATQVPMYALTASTAADPVALRHRAEQSGGALIDLQRTATADAVRELRTQRSRAIAARADGATDLVQASVYPEDGRVVVAGRMLAPVATIELEIVAPDGARTLRRIEVSGSAARTAGASGPSGSLAAQRWAALKLAALQADAERNRGEIRRLGMRFRGAGGAPAFLHTLNATAAAVPRLMLALLETHQEADGSVALPRCLQPFMGGAEALRPLKAGAPPPAAFGVAAEE
jgi:hypothetical protein